MYDYLQPIETMQRISREELAEKLDELAVIRRTPCVQRLL